MCELCGGCKKWGGVGVKGGIRGEGAGLREGRPEMASSIRDNEGAVTGKGINPTRGSVKSLSNLCVCVCVCVSLIGLFLGVF